MEQVDTVHAPMQDAHDDALQERMEDTVWTASHCKCWDPDAVGCDARDVGLADHEPAA